MNQEFNDTMISLMAFNTRLQYIKVLHVNNKKEKIKISTK